MNNELTPHIEYYDNWNVYIKGQKNSKGQEEGIWEMFYENGNIRMRIPYKEGKVGGIVEGFYENGNIRMRTPYKEGKIDGIVEWLDEQGNIVETRLWKNGKRIETTIHKPQIKMPITDEEKARELIYKFYHILSNNGSFIGTKNPDELRYNQSVNFALVVCNEVLGDMGADRGYLFWSNVKDILKLELSGNPKFRPIINENLV